MDNFNKSSIQIDVESLIYFFVGIIFPHRIYSYYKYFKKHGLRVH